MNEQESKPAAEPGKTLVQAVVGEVETAAVHIAEAALSGGIAGAETAAVAEVERVVVEIVTTVAVNVIHKIEGEQHAD